MRPFISENKIGRHTYTLRTPAADIVIVTVVFSLFLCMSILTTIVSFTADYGAEDDMAEVIIPFMITAWFGVFLTAGLGFFRFRHVVVFDASGVTMTDRLLRTTVSVAWADIADWGVQSSAVCGGSLENGRAKFTLYFSPKRLKHDPRGTDFGEAPIWESCDTYWFSLIWDSGLIDFCTRMIGRGPDHNDVADLIEPIPRVDESGTEPWERDREE